MGWRVEFGDYVDKAKILVGEGDKVNLVLSGVGPVWLYLLIAHVFHEKVREFSYLPSAVGDDVNFQIIANFSVLKGAKGENRMEARVIDLSTVYSGTAKLSEIDEYVRKVKDLAGEGQEVVLTGAGPVWLYLLVAHALHGKAKKLIYRSQVTGDIVIFDHSPF